MFKLISFNCYSNIFIKLYYGIQVFIMICWSSFQVTSPPGVKCLIPRAQNNEDIILLCEKRRARKIWVINKYQHKGMCYICIRYIHLSYTVNHWTLEWDNNTLNDANYT